MRQLQYSVPYLFTSVSLTYHRQAYHTGQTLKYLLKDD